MSYSLYLISLLLFRANLTAGLSPEILAERPFEKFLPLSKKITLDVPPKYSNLQVIRFFISGGGGDCGGGVCGPGPCGCGLVGP
jgi:hypothetical protein